MVMATLLVTALALASPPVTADTVIPVDRGARLSVENFRGEVVVRGWDRSAVRVDADLSSRQRLDITRSGATLRVRPRAYRGAPEDTDFEIHVPRWMDVRIEGNQVDVSVSGTNGEVGVETVGGDIVVEGGAGRLTLRSIQGEVSVRGARGEVEVASVNEDIVVADVEGDVHAEATNGDITLRGLRSTSARATTVNGDIDYDGTIQSDGRYVFSTHNGDVTVTMPADADATVSVATFHGEFESEFPVRLTGTTPNRQFTFTLGSGSARVEMESFNGEILLRRPR